MANQFITNQQYSNDNGLSTMSGGGGGGGSGGGGYMQGIAAIGNALNDTHKNVLTTLDYFKQNFGAFGGKRKLTEDQQLSLENMRLQNKLLGQQAVEGQRAEDWYRGLRDYFLQR